MVCALAMADGSLVIAVSSRKWLDVAAVVLTIISDSTCPGLRICPHPATAPMARGGRGRMSAALLRALASAMPSQRSDYVLRNRPQGAVSRGGHKTDTTTDTSGRIVCSAISQFDRCRSGRFLVLRGPTGPRYYAAAMAHAVQTCPSLEKGKNRSKRPKIQAPTDVRYIWH